MHEEIISGKLREVEAKIVAMRIVKRWDRVTHYEGQMRKLQRMLSDCTQGNLFQLRPERLTAPRVVKELPQVPTVSLSEAMRRGFWFCEICQRMAEVDCDKHTCEKCGSMRVRYIEPALAA